MRQQCQLRRKMERKIAEQTEKAQRQRAVDRFATETQRMLAREKVFPKRLRWQYAESLSRITNVFDTLVNIADGIKPTNKTMYEIRILLFTLSIAVLSALVAKMTQAMRVLQVPADKFEIWTKLQKSAKSSLHRQINSDKKRYEPQFGEISASTSIESVCSVLVTLLGIRSF